MFGRDFGFTFNYSLRGSWLIEQKNFNNIANAATSRNRRAPVLPARSSDLALTWAPTDALTVTWTSTGKRRRTSPPAQLRPERRHRPSKYIETGNFARNDLTVRYNVRDDLTLSAGVTNIFDAEQAEWLGGTLVQQLRPLRPSLQRRPELPSW
jgi:outer membrane receptor protein involved in Fe transport